MSKKLKREDFETQEEYIKYLEDKEEKDKRKRYLKIGILGIILLLIALLFVTCNKDIPEQITRNIPTLDRSLIGEGGTEGAFDFNNREETLKKLQKEADDSLVTFQVENAVYFSKNKEGELVSSLLFQNPSVNNFLWRTVYTLDETEEILYVSPVIRPDQYLSNVNYKELKKELPSGSYTTTATIYNYHPEFLIEMGFQVFKVTVIIE